MVKKWFLLIAGGILAPMVLFSEIKQVQSMQEINSFFEDKPTKTLGVFDIDETLTHPSLPAFQRPNIEEHRDLIKKLVKDLSAEEQYLMLNTMIATIPSTLIEEETPEILQNLQKKGIKLIALTAASSGNAGEVFIPDHRYDELKRHGIDFSNSYPKIEEIEFQELKQNFGGYPFYKQGILLANGDARNREDYNTKASVLIQFFKKTNWVPKKIVFVDDKIEHLQEMERALNEYNPKISFLGLHYVGTKNLSTEILTPVDMKNQWTDLVKKTKRISKNKEEAPCEH